MKLKIGLIINTYLITSKANCRFQSRFLFQKYCDVAETFMNRGLGSVQLYRKIGEDNAAE